MVPWNEITNKEISKRELREKYIATQAVIIQAFGRIGAYLFEHREYAVEKFLPQISKINWKRNADDWKLRVIRSNGRMINNSSAIILAGNIIKKYIDLPLTDDEMLAEEKFERNKI